MAAATLRAIPCILAPGETDGAIYTHILCLARAKRGRPILSHVSQVGKHLFATQDGGRPDFCLPTAIPKANVPGRNNVTSSGRCLAT